MARVSFVVPVFNGEPYLAQAIQSVLEQTFTDWELVVVDDGSTDGSRAIANGFAATDPRIHVIEAPHEGEVVARNLGARHATGEWIAVLDADDYADPERLEAELAFAAANPSVGVVAAMARRIDAAGRELGLTRQGPTSVEEFRALRAKAATVAVIHSTALIRSDLLEAVGGYPDDYFMAADMALFNLRLAPLTDIVAIDRPLAYRRVHTGQISRRHANMIVEADEVIVLNLRRLAGGEGVLSYGEALRHFERDPIWRRADRVRRHRRFLWQQRGIAELSGGSRAAGALLLLGTLVISPLWALDRTRRILNERRSSVKPDVGTASSTEAAPVPRAGDG